jgi:hypothetical protein
MGVEVVADPLSRAFGAAGPTTSAAAWASPAVEDAGDTIGAWLTTGATAAAP